MQGLIETFVISNKAEDWKLFIDAFKTSMKALLHYNGPYVPSVPFGHSMEISATYENIKMLLKLIKYHQHN